MRRWLEWYIGQATLARYGILFINVYINLIFYTVQQAVTATYFGRPPYQRAVEINGAKIVTADVRASDSVVHIIDAVLQPQ